MVPGSRAGHKQEKRVAPEFLCVTKHKAGSDCTLKGHCLGFFGRQTSMSAKTLMENAYNENYAWVLITFARLTCTDLFQHILTGFSLRH